MRYTIATNCGYGKHSVTRRKLEQLRMLADWQIRQAGYEPASVNASCRKADLEDQAAYEVDMRTHVWELA